MNPSLLQINTRVFLSSLKPNATLDDIPDSYLQQIKLDGFDWVWLLGVWSVGPTSRRISRSQPGWLEEYRNALSDLEEEDICGSPFAIQGYTVDSALGGEEALARIRSRLNTLGVKLMVDFIPNHIGFDHPWVHSKPEFLISGTDLDYATAPGKWARLESGKIYAYGRDPHYPGWPDTLQLNYFNPKLRTAMTQELVSIATRADGVRCDMAMLVEPEIFRQTWQQASPQTIFSSFWPSAIEAARKVNSSFLMMAEAYWNYEWNLQQHGFDFVYDKSLYDRIIAANTAEIYAHLTASIEYQSKLTRFLENHDEARAAAAIPSERHRAAAVLTYLTPGLRLFHEGQREGKKIRIPVHLQRGPKEQITTDIQEFYIKLLSLVNSPLGKDGRWSLVNIQSNEKNGSTLSPIISFTLTSDEASWLIAVNFTGKSQTATVNLSDKDLHFDTQATRGFILTDLLSVQPTGYTYSSAAFDLELEPWGACVFEVTPDT
jgi:hypothetical protein